MYTQMSPAVRKILDNSKPLSPTEQRKLVKAAKEGSKIAREALVKCNARFVFDVVVRYDQPNIEFDDLFSEGMFGLNKAIDRFDLDSPNNFMTYAIFWIRERASRHVLKNLTTIKLPENQKERNVLSYCDLDYRKSENHDTFANSIAQETFDTPEDEQFNRRVSELVELMVDDLPEKEKHIIKGVFGFYGEEMKYKECMKELKLSKFMVGTMRRKAMDRFLDSPYLMELQEALL